MYGEGEQSPFPSKGNTGKWANKIKGRGDRDVDTVLASFFVGKLASHCKFRVYKSFGHVVSVYRSLLQCSCDLCV